MPKRKDQGSATTSTTTINPDAKRHRGETAMFPVTLEVQAFDWQTDATQGVPSSNSTLLVRCWCKDRHAKLHLLIFGGFTYSVYLELPQRAEDNRCIAWNRPQLKALTEHINCSKQTSDCRPLSIECVTKQKLYYAGNTVSSFLRVRFHTAKSMKKFCSTMRETQELRYIGKVSFNVHEDNVRVLTKFLARTKIRCTQWFSVACRSVHEPDRVSTSAAEFEADFESVLSLDYEGVLPYKVMSFDIETFSSLENTFPRAINRDDAIFAISVVTETFLEENSIGIGSSTESDSSPVESGKKKTKTKREKRRRWCLCLGKPSKYNPSEGLMQGDAEATPSVPEDSLEYELIVCPDESSLLIKFADLVQSVDPDIVTGHNIWGFDMKYIYIRATLIHKQGLPNLGRLKHQTRTELTSTRDTPKCSQHIDNDRFMVHSLEEECGGGGDDEECHPSDIDPTPSAKDNNTRRLTVVDGKLTLTANPTPSTPDLARLYDGNKSGASSKSNSQGKRIANTYMRNKVHSFVMEGRVVLDTLPGARERKLDIYTLQHICTTLMGKSKDEVSPAEMFKAYRLAVGNCPTESDLIWAMAQLPAVVIVAKNSKYVEGRITSIGEVLLGRVMHYCVKDSDLVMDLFQHINMWLTCMEYSKCFGVTPYETMAFGQQIRCLSIVYIVASQRGLVLDHPTTVEACHSKLVGGRVVQPTPGLYDYVLCMDFNLLYPSIIQELNICHTTYIPPCWWDQFAEGEYNSIKEVEGDEEFRFSTKAIGIIPELCMYLVTERKVAKRAMAESATGSVAYISMDCRQKALKITANSMYGLMGAERGALKLMACSRSITSRGRQLQQLLASALSKRFDTVEIYGDTD